MQGKDQIYKPYKGINLERGYEKKRSISAPEVIAD
jgi:hypothetical protein